MLNKTFGRSLWLLPFFLVISTNLYAQKIIEGVELETRKEKSIRYLKATKSVELTKDLDSTLKLVINFDEKCNNSYKDKRKYLTEGVECKFHNNNLVETVYFRGIKGKSPLLQDHFLLLRHGYNRGPFLYFEEVKIEKNLDHYLVTQRLLSDEEVKGFIDTKLKTNFSFQQVKGTFRISKVSSDKTNIHYTYESSTDHWLLNKDMMVGEIFESTANGINDLFKSFTVSPLVP